MSNVHTNSFTMTTSKNTQASQDSIRLSRLLTYLESDHENPALLSDACSVAFDVQRFDVVDVLLEQARQRALLTSRLLNLDGLRAMAKGEFRRALDAFESIPTDDADASVAFNIAYAWAMLTEYDSANARLNDDVLRCVPGAAALKIRVLLHLGRLNEAIESGRRFANADPETAGALAVALLDNNDIEEARTYAAKAGNSVDGLTVGGLIALEKGETDEALHSLRSALEARPSHARAQLGYGLALLARREFADSTAALDVAANTYLTHAGAWIAAGWAHLFNDDPTCARHRFEEAVRVDRGFAEGHGGLAVVACYEQRFDDARRLIDLSTRLDTHCLSAAFASSLIEGATSGDRQASRKNLDALADQPLDRHGRSLLSLMAAYGARSNPASHDRTELSKQK